MKRQIVAICLILFSINSFGQKEAIAGKKFAREVSSACKSFADGGCLITTYHTLKFAQDSVYLDYHVKADCDVVSRSSRYESAGKIGVYSYQMQKKRNSPNYIIRINGYDINGLETFPDKLVEFVNDPNYSEENKIVFNLQD